MGFNRSPGFLRTGKSLEQSLLAMAAGFAFCTTAAKASSLLVCLTPSLEGYGYQQDSWVHMTAALNSATAGTVATSTDLSNLNQMLAYQGLWVDIRQFNTGTLTATESANLSSYIQTGRRVVFIGGNNNFASWNDAVLKVVGSGYTGSTVGGDLLVNQFVPITNGVNQIRVPLGGVAPSGSSLFKSAVATVWGPARNALVMLDDNTFDDTYWSVDNDSLYAGNVAAWITGGLPNLGCQWQNALGGNWTDGTQWLSGCMPSDADNPIFNLANNGSSSPGYTVSIAQAVTAQTVGIQSDRVTFNLASSTSSIAIGQGLNVGPVVGKGSLLTLTGAGSVSADNLTVAGGSGGIASISVETGATLNVSGNAKAGSTDGPGTIALNGGTLNISGNTTLGAGGVLSVYSGSALLGNLDGTGAVTCNSNLTANRIRAASMNLTGSVTLHPQTGARNNSNTVSVLGALIFAGSINAWTGALDLSNNDLIIRNGDLTQITNQLKTGYHGGAFTGAGITSSTARDDISTLTALGVLLNNDAAGHVLYPTFDNQPATAADVLVKYTFYGDANLDGVVNSSDYSQLDNGFNGSLTGWYNGDFNYDGSINSSDYSLIDNAFNQTQGMSLSADSASLRAATTAVIAPPVSAAVPEPGNFCLLGLGAAGLMSRGRRRH